MPTVVPAEGPLLQRLVAATPQALYRGLSRKALVTFDAAQAKTTWALHHQRRFALVEGDQVLAGAARYDLAGMLDSAAAQNLRPRFRVRRTGSGRRRRSCGGVGRSTLEGRHTGWRGSGAHLSNA